MPDPDRIQPLRALAVVAVGAGLWFLPVPSGLEPQAWHLFAVFITAIFSVITRSLTVFAAAILAAAAAVLTRTLKPAEMYAGFSEDFILLIVAAFLMARVAIKSGLGRRIALLVIRRIGGSSLGLAYSLVITDAVIAPAFPSNTARSGVLFPIIKAICVSSGSDPEDGTEHRLGRYLMMASMSGLSISSALWLTAMAANPAGAAVAVTFGVPVTFGSWFLAACVPSAAALALIPYLLYRAMPPELTRTPEAPRHAAEGLSQMGPMSRDERVTALTFIAMVLCWALSGPLGLDKTAVAFLGVGILKVAGVFTLKDLKREGEALEIWIWFSLLYTLSTSLNRLGFMTWLGGGIAGGLRGLGPILTYAALVLAYVLLHYLFVSQSAHMLALYGVFLGVAKASGVPVPLMAYQLLFATNYFSCITPQGSSANVLFAGSGYLTQGEMYRYGALVTAANTVLYLTLGTLWIRLILPFL